MGRRPKEVRDFIPWDASSPRRGGFGEGVEEEGAGQTSFFGHEKICAEKQQGDLRCRDQQEGGTREEGRNADTGTTSRGEGHTKGVL